MASLTIKQTHALSGRGYNAVEKMLMEQAPPISMSELVDEPIEAYFSVNIDHFTNNGVSAQYNMRYLYNEKNVVADNAPILFYCGNEDKIENFYKATGFITNRMAKNL